MAQISVKITPSKVQQIMEAGKKQLSPEEFEELEALILDFEIYGLTPWINTRLGTLMSKIEWELELEPSPEWAEALQACDYAFLGNELKAMCYEIGASPIGHKKRLCARLYKRKVPEIVAVMEPHIEKMTPEQIKEEIERYAKVERLPQAIPKGFYVIERGVCPYCHKGYPKGEYLIRWPYSRGPKHVRGCGVHVACYHQLEKEYPDPELPQTEHLYVSKLRKVKDRLEELRRTDPEEFYHRKEMFEQAIKERGKGQVKTMPELTLADLRELLKFTGRLYR